MLSYLGVIANDLGASVVVISNFKPVAEKGYASQSSIINKITESLSSLGIYAHDAEHNHKDFPMSDVAELVEVFEGGEVSFLDAIRRSRVFNHYNGESDHEHALRRSQFWEKIGSYDGVGLSEMHLEVANNLERMADLCLHRISILDTCDDKILNETKILEKSSEYFQDIAEILRNPNVHSAAYDAAKQKGESVRDIYASKDQDLLLRPGMALD
ncbi:MAG: hypothetical protein CL565_04790 [Alphaproteobacteria bacterium]|nr:hypothetical protein [Alphaproteobacteria bacterium]